MECDPSKVGFINQRWIQDGVIREATTLCPIDLYLNFKAAFIFQYLILNTQSDKVSRKTFGM